MFERRPVSPETLPEKPFHDEEWDWDILISDSDSNGTADTELLDSDDDGTWDVTLQVQNLQQAQTQQEQASSQQGMPMGDGVAAAVLGCTESPFSSQSTPPDDGATLPPNTDPEDHAPTPWTCTLCHYPLTLQDLLLQGPVSQVNQEGVCFLCHSGMSLEDMWSS